MNVAHVTLNAFIQNFVENTPVSFLSKNFKNGALEDKSMLFNHNLARDEGSLLMHEDKNEKMHCVFRAHKSAVIPPLMYSLVKSQNLSGDFTIYHKGKTYKVEVEHDEQSGWFICSSPLLDELTELAKARSQE